MAFRYPKVADLVREQRMTQNPRKNPFGYRVPTLEEIAGAFAYIINEFTSAHRAYYRGEGEMRIDGEMWAEGLASARDISGDKRHDPTWYAEMMNAAREAKPQLTDDQWAHLAARADHIRAMHHMDKEATPRFKENPRERQSSWIGVRARVVDGTKRGRVGKVVAVGADDWDWTVEFSDGTRQKVDSRDQVIGIMAGNPAPDASDAIELYKTFHRYEPKDIGEFPKSFKIPKKLKCAGPAKWTTYRSGKVDPATLKLPKRPVNYIHEHNAGVHVYVPVDDEDFDEIEGDIVSVPAAFREISALTKLGESLGFCVKVGDGELEVENEKPLPELYSSQDGKCLYVIQDKREVVAMIWGGALGVFARGIDG